MRTPNNTEYPVNNLSPNRATVCLPHESNKRWWGPAGHEVGDRIWHHGVIALAPAVAS